MVAILEDSRALTKMTATLMKTTGFDILETNGELEVAKFTYIKKTPNAHYLGKLNRGNIVVKGRFGDCPLFMAKSGYSFFAGPAGDAFAMRDEGSVIVVKGVHDYSCEKISGGVVLILGEYGRNTAKDMNGGVVFIFTQGKEDVLNNINLATVTVTTPTEDDISYVLNLVMKFVAVTSSMLGKLILFHWHLKKRNLLKIVPKTAGPLKNMEKCGVLGELPFSKMSKTMIHTEKKRDDKMAPMLQSAIPKDNEGLVESVNVFLAKKAMTSSSPKAVLDASLIDHAQAGKHDTSPTKANKMIGYTINHPTLESIIAVVYYWHMEPEPSEAGKGHYTLHEYLRFAPTLSKENEETETDDEVDTITFEDFTSSKSCQPTHSKGKVQVHFEKCSQLVITYPSRNTNDQNSVKELEVKTFKDLNKVLNDMSNECREVLQIHFPSNCGIGIAAVAAANARVQHLSVYSSTQRLEFAVTDVHQMVKMFGCRNSVTLTAVGVETPREAAILKLLGADRIIANQPKNESAFTKKYKEFIASVGLEKRMATGRTDRLFPYCTPVAKPCIQF